MAYWGNLVLCGNRFANKRPALPACRMTAVWNTAAPLSGMLAWHKRLPTPDQRDQQGDTDERSNLRL